LSRAWCGSSVAPGVGGRVRASAVGGGGVVRVQRHNHAQNPVNLAYAADPGRTAASPRIGGACSGCTSPLKEVVPCRQAYAVPQQAGRR